MADYIALLRRWLQSFGKQFAALIAATCAFAFVVGMLRGMDFWSILAAMASLTAAIVPEGVMVVAAVRMRRATGCEGFDWTCKAARFLLGANCGEVFVMLCAMLLGWGTPMRVIHLLLINLLVDVFPALSLGTESPEIDAVDRKQAGFRRTLFREILPQGALIGALTLAGYHAGRFAEFSAYFPPSREVGVTVAFLVFSLSRLSQVLSVRSEQSLFTTGFFSDPSMTRALFASLSIVFIVCLTPPLERLFGVVDISVLHWMLTALLSVTPLILAEIGKAVSAIRKTRYRQQI